MKTKELKIQIPKGYEIDEENSTFEKIVFKPKEIKEWRCAEKVKIGGYYINNLSCIEYCEYDERHWKDKNVFATEKQAKSALAMAQISQIIANDKRFGGAISDKEWSDFSIDKYVIARTCNGIETYYAINAAYHFLAFHTSEQRDLFLKENEDLVKDYLMLD